MDFFWAAGIIAGILAGIWVPASVMFSLHTPAVFFAWATFFALGGKFAGFKGALTTNLAGVVWGIIIIQLAALFGPVMGKFPGMGVAVFIGSMGMIVPAKYVPALRFIPGLFLGCATYFSAGFDWKASIIGLVIGAVIAYISQYATGLITKKEPETQSENS